MSKKYKMHIISGTHWDREWRHTAEQSKLRLVDLVDNIIDVLENKPDYKCFCVDGGTIVIEDYLAVRPENRERIKKLVQQKKMLMVNWYTLPETNTVAPESLIRNLIKGHAMAKEFGGGMKSGYTATSYGQNSQMPQLYQGFDIDTCIFYRGTNRHVIKTPLYKWVGADGSSLDALRTFDDVTRTNWFFFVHSAVVLGKTATKDLNYYYNVDELPVHPADMDLYQKAFTLLNENFDYHHDGEIFKQAIENIRNQVMPYAIGNHLLALNMEDNDEPYRYLPEMVENLNKISDDIEFVQESMDEYMDTIRSVMKPEDMYVHHGEMRYTTMEYGNFNSLYGATHSSRIKLKVLNDNCENYLLNHAEPLASFASFYGKEYPRTIVDRAWDFLLKCHAHDSICGAAVDRAHDDMLYNFSVAQTVAEEVTNRSMAALYKQINTASKFQKDDHIITVFNTLPFARKEVIPVVIDTPAGPGRSGFAGIGGQSMEDEFYDIIDINGNVVEHTELTRDTITIGVERELDTKAARMKVNRRRMLIAVDVPAFGYANYAMRFREPKYVYEPPIGENRKLIARDGGLLENDNLKVVIHSNGTFSLTNKKTGKTMDNMHYFTDSGEHGSAHVSCQPTRNYYVTSLGAPATITMMESNLQRGVFRIDLTMQIPAAVTNDGKDRLAEKKELPITTYLTLEKDSDVLKIKTVLTNDCRDHKLCVNFPSNVDTDWAYAESAWDVIKRTVKWTVDGDNQEKFQPFQPMQNFVDLSDGKEGLALLNRGLREYEVQDDDARTLKLTLLRTQRAYMTATSDMIPEELAQYTGQHSIGKMEFEYALYPHTGDWQEANVYQKAYGFKTTMNAIKGVVKDGVLPAAGSFLTVSDEQRIMVSAIKQAEDKSGTIVRLFNTTGETVKFDVSLMLPVSSVSEVKLNETLVKDIDVKDGKFSAELAPHKIITFLLKA